LHHIISDAWSMGILVGELSVLYDAFAAGKPSPLPALPIQYADFAHWQRRWRQRAEVEAQLSYWQQQLRAPLPPLELPTDRPRGSEISLHTARQTLEFPRELGEAIKHLSSQEHGTLLMTLMAAFNILLYGYTGQEDLCVATPISNRNRWETEALIGPFTNTVLLRTNLSGNPTYQEILQRVRTIVFAAYANQDIPFEELVQTLERESGFARRALCQVMLILQHPILRPQQHPHRTLSFLEVDQGTVLPELAPTTLDIILVVRERPYGQGLVGSCVYKTALFEATTVYRLLQDFQAVLQRLIEQPKQSFAALRSLWGTRDLSREALP
jgi:hypothetical protein